MKHEEMMRKALGEAQLAYAAGEVPVGAVVACGEEIVASAHNEREALLDPTAHAEVLALRRAAKRLGRRRLSGCTLYVTLEPCPMCAGAIVMSGVERVVFGAFDRAAGCAGSVYNLPEDPVFAHRAVCSGGLLEADCAEMIDAFFSGKRE